jgi:hypothetical protein
MLDIIAELLRAAIVVNTLLLRIQRHLIKPTISVFQFVALYLILGGTVALFNVASPFFPAMSVLLLYL